LELELKVLVEVIEFLARMLLVLREVEAPAVSDAFQLSEIRRGERVEVLDVDRHLRIVRQLILLVLAQAEVRFLDPSERHQFIRSTFQNSYHVAASSGWQNHSISICSNSRLLNMKFRGVTSLRKDFPICATPKGIFTRVVSTMFLKFRKIPCAVSGRR